MSREEVVPQEDVRYLIPVFHTDSACCGAATAYLLRRIAYRAGAYAPGIQEVVFHELTTTLDGGNLERVQRWFAGRLPTLHELGYRLQCRRAALPTAELLEWVRQGRGYRGAMVPTDDAHAVGISVDRLDAKGDDDLVMIDPWPSSTGQRERVKVPPATLEAVHRLRGYQALVYFWTGWS